MSTDNGPTYSNEQLGVWPPPPARVVAAEFPFRTEFRTVQGTVPDFRVGHMSFSDQGLLIQGKAVPPNEIQIPILIASLALKIGWLIAYFIMEYAARRDRSIQVPLSQVNRVVLNATKRRLCVVYDMINSGGRTKRYSLTTQMPLEAYANFMMTAQQFLPGIVGEGRIKPSTAPLIWVVVIGGMIYLGYMVFVLVTGGF